MARFTYDKARRDKEYDGYRKMLDVAAEGSHPYVVFLGLHSYDTPVLLRRIGEGLSYAAFERLQHCIGVSAQEMAHVVQISPRTLARRKAEGKLLPDESDRLVRLSRIFGHTLALFEGDYDGARDWLLRKQVGLGGARPLDLVGSDVGAREVEALIGRLEHGVFT